MRSKQDRLQESSQPSRLPRVLLVIAAGLIILGLLGIAAAVLRLVLDPPQSPAGSLVTQFLFDATGDLSASDVLQASSEAWIHQSAGTLATFGYSKAAVWCRIQFSMHSTEAAVVELPTTRIDHVDWFSVTGDRTEYLCSNGYRDVADSAVASAQYPLIQLQPAEGQEYQVLFRATSECALAIPIRVGFAANRYAVELSRSARAQFEIGGAVAIVVVCLTLALCFRDLSLGLLGVCGLSVVCYGVLFDTVLSLPGYRVPAWMPRAGCNFFCTLQAAAMLVFSAAHAGFRNLSPFDRRLFASACVISTAYLILHAWLPYSKLVPWLNGLCVLNSMCSVWVISIRYRDDGRLLNMVPVVALMVSHLPGLLLILYFHGYAITLLSPQSLRMIAMPIVFCGLAFSLLQRRRIAENLRLHAALASVGESEARLVALRYQLNPHMLMNCLTAISSLSRRAPEEIPTVIRNLSNILHARLKPATGLLWSLEQELNLARSLVALEQVRFNEQLNFSVSADPDVLNCRLPEMLLQPLVENAIKYCTNDNLAPELRIEACVVHDLLQIQVVNSLKNDAGVTPSEGLHIGHANVRNRLQLTYGGSAEFHFSIHGGVAIAQIRIPTALESAPNDQSPLSDY